MVPVDPNLVLQIDSSLLPPPPPVEWDSVSSLDAGFVYELGFFGDVNVSIDWGDNTTSVATTDGSVGHTYLTSGEYTIRVSGLLTGFGQATDNIPLVGAEYLVGVSSFGDLGLTSLDYAFFGAVNLVSVPSALPSTVVSLEDTFWDADLFNHANIGAWDTSNVTNMAWMFEDTDSFNQDISEWDTGSVIDMSNMFNGASVFNQSLSSWDTGSVTDMRGMFLGASLFNQSLSSWDTGSVTDMSGMFDGASLFNQSLSTWNVSLVTNMEQMLDGTALSTANYSATLIGWASRSVKPNVQLGAIGLAVFFESEGCDAHQLLDTSWTISDSSVCST